MTPRDETPTAHFSDLFERARRALAEHNVGTGPAAMDPDLLDEPVNGSSGHVAAQLRIDDHTREVIIRFYDVQTGSTIREVAPQEVALAASRLRVPLV